MSFFSFAYWKTAAGELHHLKILTLAAVLIALDVALGSFFIPVAENLHISFGFMAMALGAMIYGPIVGLFVGAAADLVGFIVHPFGLFFPGYTLSAMLACFIYGLFFYRQKITILRIVLAKLIVNFAVNVGLGCLWSSMLAGKGYLYFLIHSLVKNTLMLPIETVMLYAVLQILLPVLIRAGAVHGPHSGRIPLI